MASPIPPSPQHPASYWSAIKGRVSSTRKGVYESAIAAKNTIYHYTVSKPVHAIKTTSYTAYLKASNKVSSLTALLNDTAAQAARYVGDALNSAVQTGTSLTGDISTAITQTPIVLGGENFNPLLPPAPDAKEILAKIKGLSLDILDESEKNGVRRDLLEDRPPVEPKFALPASAIPSLRQETVLSSDNLLPAQETTALLSVNEGALNHKVPLATGPRILSDPADIKKKTDDELDRFCKKLSDFSTLYYMVATICNIEEPDNTSLFQMVSAASKKNPDGTYPSLWTLLNEKYQLSFFQKLRAGLFYFWFYKITALIPNTVDTYLKCFVNTVRVQLTDKNSMENSDKQIQRVVDNANGFLKSYNAATDDFLNDTIPSFSSLTEYRTNRIAMHYGGSIWEDAKYQGPGFEQALEGATQKLSAVELQGGRPGYAMLVKPYMNRAREILCKQFSRAIVDTYSPHVEFFKNWKHHPIGTIFTPIYDAVEGILNKYLRYVMKTQILPYSFLSVIEESIDDATSKHNLPFSIALTRFVTDQMKRLEETVAQPTLPPHPSIAPPPAIEHLGQLVTELLTLEEVLLETKAQIKEHRKTLAAEKSEFDKTIQEEIKKPITKASQFLFQYIAQPANVEEMFSQLLEVLNFAFTDTTPRGDEQYKKSKADLEKRIEDLKEKSNRVFKSLVRQSVEKKVKGTPLAQEIAQTVFEDQKAEASSAFDQLDYLSRKILNAFVSSEEIDLRKEIGSFAQIMKTFAEREKSYHGIESLDHVDQEEIRRLLSPLYEKAALLIEQTKKLQEIQRSYSLHRRIVEELVKIETGLQSILEINSSKRRARLHFPLEMREKIRSSIAEIGSNLPKFPQIQEELTTRLDDLCKRFDSFDSEIRLLQGIERLFPQNGSRGLIKNLLDYRRGEREELPREFHIKDCLAEIHQILSGFNQEIFPEAEALKTQIEQTLRHLKSGFKGEWNRLGGLIGQLRNSHEQKKKQAALEFQTSKKNFHQAANRYNSGYILRKQENKGDMLKAAENLSEKISLMKSEAEQIQKGAQFHLTESRMGAAGALVTGLSAGVGGAISSLLGTGFLTGASMGGSLVSTGLYRGIERKNLSRVIDKGGTNIAPVATAVAAGGAAAALPSLLSYLSPGLGIGASALTIAAGMGLGHKAGSAALGEAVDSGQAKVLVEVERRFENAFKFAKSNLEHFSHGAITRLMKTTIDTHSPA